MVLWVAGWLATHTPCCLSGHSRMHQGLPQVSMARLVCPPEVTCNLLYLEYDMYWVPYGHDLLTAIVSLLLSMSTHLSNLMSMPHRNLFDSVKSFLFSRIYIKKKAFLRLSASFQHQTIWFFCSFKLLLVEGHRIHIRSCRSLLQTLSCQSCIMDTAEEHWNSLTISEGCWVVAACRRNRV